VKVHRARIEAAPAIAADVVTARALADLPKLLAYAVLLDAGRHGLFPKGRRVEDELTSRSNMDNGRRALGETPPTHRESY
jgi:16S rRNA (guanine527-N7)-methyltransferase